MGVDVAVMGEWYGLGLVHIWLGDLRVSRELKEYLVVKGGDNSYN